MGAHRATHYAGADPAQFGVGWADGFGGGGHGVVEEDGVEGGVDSGATEKAAADG